MGVSKAELRLAPQDKIVLHRNFVDHLEGRRIAPVNVEISPCGVCNASCDFCFYANGDLGGHRKVFLDKRRLIDLLSECSDMGVKSISWTGGGEPSLYPDIHAVVQWVVMEGMDQGMFTNALAAPRYNPASLQWMRVTMTDKPFREEYIKALRPTRTLSIAFNYAGPQDDQYLRDTLALGERCGVDYVQVRPALAFHGQTVDIQPPAWTHPLMHVTDYKFEDARKKHGYATCEGYHFVPFVWEDGDVSVCAYMRQHDGYVLGNVYSSTLAKILKKAPDSVPVVDQCQVCCKNHEINKAIHSARALEDVNFP